MSSNFIINRAMAHLAEGGCSEHILCSRLRQEFEDDPDLEQRISETILYLRQCNLINDERVARGLAERHSHKGDSVIIHHLEKLGIGKNHAQMALNSIGTEYLRALMVATNLYVSNERVGFNELQNQIMRFLCRHSFSYQTLRQVIDTLFNQGPGIRCSLPKIMKNEYSFLECK